MRLQCNIAQNEIEEESKEELNETSLLLKWGKSVVTEMMKHFTEDLKIELVEEILENMSFNPQDNFELS